MTPQKQVWIHLQKHGAKTVHELIDELPLKPVQIYNATMKLKNDGIIGKRDDKWGIGFEHDTTTFKRKVLELVEQGKYDSVDIAGILGAEVKQVSTEVSRLRRQYGLNIKRVYVIGE